MTRAITTRSRFIICIPNWPVKLTGLALVWVLLLFLSCKDDAALVGFPKDPRLNTRYVEIPLSPSVFLHSPISTRNTLVENLSRILVGRHNDPDLGAIEAKGYFTLSPPLQSVIPDPASTFESLELNLKFDYYFYGPPDSTDQRFQVVEIDEVLSADGDLNNNTTVTTKMTVVGDTTIALGPTQLNDGWSRYLDSNPTNNLYYTLTIKITGPMGQNLLDDLINNPSIFTVFEDFTTKYSGFEVSMPQGDKIFGITPVYSLPTPEVLDSKLTLRYMENTTPRSVDFPIFYGATPTGAFIPVVSFSNITADRSMTPLNGLAPFQDLTPSTNNTYVQSGTGVLAKYDLSNFFTFADTAFANLVPGAVVINSAEMVFTNISSKRPPQLIELRLLDSLNQFRKFTVVNGANKSISDPYLVKILPGISIQGAGTDASTVSIFSDLSGATKSIDPETGEIGTIVMTEFFQQILNNKNNPRRVKAFSVFPVKEEFAKTVSSLVLNPSSMTLRIYYSKPITTIQ